MKCPKCNAESKVMDSRDRTTPPAIRRRRECLLCGHRWTTYEIKSDLVDLLWNTMRKFKQVSQEKMRENLTLADILSLLDLIQTMEGTEGEKEEAGTDT